MKIKAYLTTFQISQYHLGYEVWLSEKKDDDMQLEVEIDLKENICRYGSNGMGGECLIIKKIKTSPYSHHEDRQTHAGTSAQGNGYA